MRQFKIRQNLVFMGALISITMMLFSLPAVPVQARGFTGSESLPKIEAGEDPGFNAPAVADETQRMIVQLDVPFDATEMALEGRQAYHQQMEISNAQRQVANALANCGGEVLYEFKFVPFSLVRVNAQALAVLNSLPIVAGVEQDAAEVSDAAQGLSRLPEMLDELLLNGGIPALAGAEIAADHAGAGQTIAILDTGVDRNHPYLAGKVVSEACYSDGGGEEISSSVCPGGVISSTQPGSALPYAGSCPAGQCDHGTLVAGIAAGQGPSYSGMAKDASIIAIQVFSRFENTCSDGAGGYKSCILSWPMDQALGLQRVFELRDKYNIAAVNISIGAESYNGYCDDAPGNALRKYWIDLLKAAGIATVISSGNYGLSDAISSPACISSAISVGAAAKYTRTVADYSNSASILKLLAPGKSIYSCVPGGGFDYLSGTSMAAPYVAGAWAVIKSSLPDASVDEVLNALTLSGEPILDYRNGITTPRIDVKAALLQFSSP